MSPLYGKNLSICIWNKCTLELFIVFVVICVHYKAFANETEKCDCEQFTFVQSPKINGRFYYNSPNKHIFWWNKKEHSMFVHSYAGGGFTSNGDVKDWEMDNSLASKVVWQKI